MRNPESRAVRRSSRSSNGWNNGDIDELVLLFSAALVSDGHHPSKVSRNHLITEGYAFRCDGYTALTMRGKFAALLAWPMPLVWLNHWIKAKRGTFKFPEPQEVAD